MKSLLLVAAVCSLLAGCASDAEPPAWTQNEARRLLSDAEWVWCVANPDAVDDASVALGMDAPGSESSPYDLYRGCAAAAEAGGSVQGMNPAENLLAAVRELGFSANDDTVLEVGLGVCRAFDEDGVTRRSVGIEVQDLWYAISPLAHHAVNDPEYLAAPPEFQEHMRGSFGYDFSQFAAEAAVGAISVTICPEYAEDLAAIE